MIKEKGILSPVFYMRLLGVIAFASRATARPLSQVLKFCFIEFLMLERVVYRTYN